MLKYNNNNNNSNSNNDSDSDNDNDNNNDKKCVLFDRTRSKALITSKRLDQLT